MRPLSAAELLAVWERSLVHPPTERALLLLAAASPETPADELARLSVGRRDRRLLELRQWTFGDRLVSRTDCPECGARLELDFAVGEVAGPTQAGEPDEPPPRPLAVEAHGYRVEFRLPDSSDLEELARRAEAGDGRRVLLERCVSRAERRGRRVAASRLPKRVSRLVVERMAAADPLADLRLELRCAGCGHRWRATFDIVSFFWTELDAWARRLLREIHTLARAYGWSESEILALSPWRRRAYLELAQA